MLHTKFTLLGFAIDKDLMITAGHFCSNIVNGSKEEQIVEKKLSYYFMIDEVIYHAPDYNVVAIHEEYDLCLIERKDHGLLPVKISKQDLFSVRDKTFTVGAPRGTFPIESEGHVSLPQLNSKGPINEKILISMPIYAGNSGSPVFNDQGKVIGVIVMGDKYYSNIAIVTSAKHLRAFISQNTK